MDRSAGEVNMIELPCSEAHGLCKKALEKAGYSASDAEKITNHLVDSELRGSPFAGLARALSIITRLQTSETISSSAIEVLNQGPTFVRLDGHDAVGYLVAERAVEMAIVKAKAAGVAVVGANNFWFSGNLSYYAEMATREDLVCIMASNALPLVAPEGALEGRFGTNPFCIGFPTSRADQPVIWDIGTSNIMHAQIKRAERLGIDLPEGAAYDKDGHPTLDPAAAAVMTVWGGHKGSGLATMIQLLGMAAGSSAVPPTLSGFGFLALVFNPAVLRPIEELKQEADEYGEYLRSAKTMPGSGAVRMPFDGSYERRKVALERGTLNFPEKVVEQLRTAGSHGLEL